MAESSLAKKLSIKPGYRVAVINAPENYLSKLGPLPDGVELSEKPEGSFDVVQLFVQNIEELNRLGPAALRAIKHDGLLWFSYPKQTSKVKTDLTRDRGWDIVYEAGYEPVAMAAIDETWSAFRFRPRELVKRGKK